MFQVIKYLIISAFYSQCLDRLSNRQAREIAVLQCYALGHWSKITNHQFPFSEWGYPLKITSCPELLLVVNSFFLVLNALYLTGLCCGDIIFFFHPFFLLLCSPEPPFCPLRGCTDYSLFRPEKIMFLPFLFIGNAWFLWTLL